MTWRVQARATLGSLELDVELDGDRDPIVIIGPNGSGKTSILRIIAGLVATTSAEVEVDGHVLASTRRGVAIPVERRGIGYVPQGYGLFANMSVLDNVAFGLSVGPRRRPRTERRAIARDTLRDLDCEHLADRRPDHLSGGERQRVAVARALAIKPALLLLDEPLAALDAAARRQVRTFLANHVRDLGCASLVVTHEPRDVVALDATVVALDAGRVAQRGPLDALRSTPATPFIAEFVHDL